jgi:IclR family pca regulon transcriptional regulator
MAMETATNTAPKRDPRQSPLFVRSLEKGLKVLSAYDASHRRLGLGEVARRTGLSKSAAQRFTHTLHALGYLRQDKETRAYGLSPQVLALGFAYLRSDELVTRATPHLLDANKRCEETVNLTEPDGLQIVYVARVPSRHVVSVDVVLGTRLPMFCTAPGRAILAYLPEDEARDLIDRSKRVQWTPHTVTDREALMRILEDVRQRGYCIAEQETYLGDMSIAAPVLDSAGRPVAAVNIAVPTTRWSQADCRRQLVPTVLETARVISAEIGAGQA